MSGPLPTLVASLNCWRVSGAIWTATLTPASAPNASATFWTVGARSASVQMTRSAFASRAGSFVLSVAGVPDVAVLVVVPEAVVVSPEPAVVDVVLLAVPPPPQAVTSRAAEPMAATAPSARLCI